MDTITADTDRDFFMGAQARVAGEGEGGVREGTARAGHHHTRSSCWVVRTPWAQQHTHHLVPPPLHLVSP